MKSQKGSKEASTAYTTRRVCKNYISWLHAIEDLWEWVAASDAFLQPSHPAASALSMKETSVVFQMFSSAAAKKEFAATAG